MPRLKKTDALTRAVGARVRELRLEREVTLEKLAYENDLSKGTISDLERGLVRPSVVTLEKIASGLDVELLDLFTRPEDSERHRLVDLSRSASASSIKSAITALDGNRGDADRRGARSQVRSGRAPRRVISSSTYTRDAYSLAARKRAILRRKSYLNAGSVVKLALWPKSRFS